MTAGILLSVLILLSGVLIGILIFPLLLFLRARRSDYWDDSNITNIYRVIAYLCTHPDKFGEMRLENGKYPFWYINKDEFKEITPPR